MNLIKITDLTKILDISSRSLRYYEQVGLIKSIRPKFEQYRFYDDEAIARVKQIIILRKMQIPIKDILRIYDSKDTTEIVQVFIEKINAIDDEVSALEELRGIVNDFLKVMVEKGIKKISVLPLLYEEIEKQLDYNSLVEPDKMSKKLTYEELTAISEKVAPAMDVRIVKIPSMGVLSSYIKESNKEHSDTEAFHKWRADNNVLPDTEPGLLDNFDFYDLKTRQLVYIRKTTDGFVNNSHYLEYYFEGGLFAVLGTYLEEDDMGEAYDRLTKYIKNKLEHYIIDEEYIEKNRFDSMGSQMLSPFSDKRRYDIFIPIKKCGQNNTKE